MQNWRLFRIIAGRPRLFIAFGTAILAYFVLNRLHPQAVRVVMAWNIGTALFLAASAELFLRSDHLNISADAARQEEGEWSIFALTLLGAVMSFVAIFLFSGAAQRKQHQEAYLLFVVVTLALSWLMVNVSFAYRYAHEYYSKLPSGELERGLEFPRDDYPDYLDFVYFAFVLGMTFQVSDTDITSKKFRRLATLHGMIGFLFNTVVLALSVNLAASLL